MGGRLDMQERGFRLSPRNHDVTNIKIELKKNIFKLKKWLVNGLQETAQPIIDFM